MATYMCCKLLRAWARPPSSTYPVACGHSGESVGHYGRPYHWHVSAMDVADWLRKLGLDQYEPAFRANEIDARVLPSLTGEDLKDLGVTLVGHRRRLLDAIAALG